MRATLSGVGWARAVKPGPLALLLNGKGLNGTMSSAQVTKQPAGSMPHSPAKLASLISRMVLGLSADGKGTGEKILPQRLWLGSRVE